MKTNRRQPKRDAERGAKCVAQLLAHLDRDDMLALLTELARQPELYDAIESALSVRSRKTKSRRHRPADKETFRREVIGILHSLDARSVRPSQAYWHVRDVVEKLRTVQEKARRLLDHGDAENALALLLI